MTEQVLWFIPWQNNGGGWWQDNSSASFFMKKNNASNSFPFFPGTSEKELELRY